MIQESNDFRINLYPLIEEAKKNYLNIFKVPPKACGYSPGRVNLIGDHTDYNEGYVLPMTISRYTIIVGSKNNFSECRVITLLSGLKEINDITFSLSNIKKYEDCVWINYLMGVIDLFPDKSKIPSFNAVIVSSIPSSQGLSSSASLEVSFLEFLFELVHQEGLEIIMSKKDKAQICQQAENEYLNIPCGIMDQFIVYYGNESFGLLIDCRNLTYDLIDIKTLFDRGYIFVVIASNIAHDLADGRFSKRKRRCQIVAKFLGKTSLRDVNMKQLETSKRISLLPKQDYLYSRHVITEIERTLSGSKALKRRLYEAFGLLMVQSHFSLKNDYAVSHPIIDDLVDYTNEFESVCGSRITGAGFGGCTITLMKKIHVDKFVEYIKKRYKKQLKLDFYLFSLGKSAGRYNLNNKVFT